MKMDTVTESVVERVAGIDVGKAEVVVCVRMPSDEPGRRASEVRSFPTMTQDLLDLGDWLAQCGATRVVMEATGAYWKPVFYVLEGFGFEELWLVNAHDVKHVPGRRKSDALDAQWLATLAERGMLRPSFVPTPQFRQLRDLTRYRSDLVVARNSEKQRVEKLLEDAQVKLSVVASDIFGVGGRQMLKALARGERDPKVLAQMAKTVMRLKIPLLERAFVGRFNTHHEFLLSQMLRRVEQFEADIAIIDAKIAEHVESFRDVIDLLEQIPGIGPVNATAIIAEIGVDMSRFPDADHLASWARFAPVTMASAGKTRGRAATGKGNRYLARALGEAVLAARRGATFIGARYRRLVRKRGKLKAIVAVGRTLLVQIWNLLTHPETGYIELGADWQTQRANHQRSVRRLTKEFEQLGYHIELTPLAA